MTKAIFRVVYILPWLFTVAVIAVIWRLLLDPNGVVNYILTTSDLRTEVEWLASPSTALWALTFINIWSGYPFFMISLLAGLQGISRDLYEAAQVDGASAIQRFFNVTIPQLKPDHHQHGGARLIWTISAVRADLDDHRRRAHQCHRDAQHLHLQAGLQQLRVRRGVGERCHRPTPHDGPGVLLCAAAEGEVIMMATRQARRRLGMKIGVIVGCASVRRLRRVPGRSGCCRARSSRIREVFKVPPRLITENISFDAYRKILTDPTKLRFFLNSYIVALSVTALTLLVGDTRRLCVQPVRVPLQAAINIVIVSVQAVPPITLLIPFFGLMVALGLYNTYRGLILTYMVFTLPYAIIMMTGVLQYTAPRARRSRQGGWGRHR